MAGENFQDNVVYGTDGVLRVSSVIGISNTGGVLALAANPSVNQTINFPDSSGTIVLSGQAIQGLGVSTGGNTAGSTGTTIGTVVLVGVGAVTLSQSTAAGSLATISISVPSAGTGNIGAIAAGTQTGSSGTIIFSNSNGVTFGMAGSLTVTASHAINVSGGTTSNNLSAITFSNSNGISFGLNASTMTASVATSLTNINVSGGTTSNNLSAITFSNSNGVSFGLNASTMTASVATSLTNINVSAGTTSNNLSAITFSNLNGITFGLNASTITASHVINVSGGTTSNNLSAITFSNSNGVSFGLNASTMTASVATSLTNINISAGTTSNNLSAVTFSNSNGVSFGLNGSTVTGSYNPLFIIAGTGTISSGTVSFPTFSNGISAGFNVNTLTLSFALNVSAGTTSNNLSSMTFSNSNNVSFGLNASTITATVENKLTAFQWPLPFHDTNFTISNATFSLQKVYVPMHITATRMLILMDLTGNSGSTGALTFSAAVYTLSGSTASLASSGSRQLSWTSGSSTTQSSAYGGVSGTQYRTLAINLTMTPGDYMFGYHFRTTNDGTWRIFGRQAVSIANALDANQTNYFLDGTSVSSFTTAFPASINVTDTNFARTGAAALRQPGFIVVGTF
jgi:hypothetical protein